MGDVYTIWVVTKPGYIHTQSFNDIAYPLRDAFVELGHKCEVTYSSRQCVGTTIVLAGHLLRRGDFLPDNMIVYNLEQAGSNWIGGYYLKLMQRCPVWDYSMVNTEYLKQHGVNAKLLEVGYMPMMENIPKVEQDIDFLFYGSMNERRKKIVDDLRAVTAFGLYGELLHDLIARTKVILNIHFYPAKIFEITRCAPAMANGKCVLSEVGTDKHLEDPYAAGIVWSTYDGFVDSAHALLADEKQLIHIANRGYEIFSKRRYTEFLRGVL